MAALSPVFAQSAAVKGKSGADFNQMNGWLTDITGMVNKLGLIVAFVGVIMLIRSFATDNAETRSRAVFIMVAGGVLSALTATLTVANLSW